MRPKAFRIASVICAGSLFCSMAITAIASQSTEIDPSVFEVEKPASYAVADSSTYDGTDPLVIIEEHCYQCHSIVPYRGADMSSPNPYTDWLLTYKAESEEAAQAVAEEMALVCNNMSQEQIDALASFYATEV